MPNLPNTQDDLNETVTQVASNTYGDKPYVIPTPYTKYDIADMPSSSRTLYRTAMANLIEPHEVIMGLAPGSPNTRPKGQTDYYWTRQTREFSSLVSIVQNIAGRRR